MRTTKDENTRIGETMARRLSEAKGPVSVLLPSRGLSAIDRTGQPFDDPGARRALHDAIRSGLRHGDVRELDLHINDAEFADTAANTLISLMQRGGTH
jgi:uncharacterized protein (UPF0261 family)